MAAAGITALLKKMDYKDVVVAIGNLDMVHTITGLPLLIFSWFSCLFIFPPFYSLSLDGSVFRYHPHFPNIMRSRIQQLMGIDYTFDLMLSTDGSGRGAALVAAVLAEQQKWFHFWPPSPPYYIHSKIIFENLLLSNDYYCENI